MPPIVTAAGKRDIEQQGQVKQCDQLGWDQQPIKDREGAEWDCQEGSQDAEEGHQVIEDRVILIESVQASIYDYQYTKHVQAMQWPTDMARR